MNRVLKQIAKHVKEVDVPSDEYQPKYWVEYSYQQILTHLEHKIKNLHNNFPIPYGYKRSFNFKTKKPNVGFMRKKIALLEIFYEIENLEQLKSNMKLPTNISRRFDERVQMMKDNVLQRFNE